MHPMVQSTILFKKPGHIIPEDFLKHVLSKHGKVLGFVARPLDEKTNSFQLVSEKTVVTPDMDVLANINEMQTAGKDVPIFFCLGNYPEDTKEEDLQPFTINNSDTGETVIGYMLEGDFPNQAGDAPEPTNFAENVIGPKLLDIIIDKEGDMDAVRKKIEGDVFKADLLRETSHRGYFAFMMAEGDPIVVSKNELGDEYEWGSTSNHHDFSALQEQEPAPVAKKGLSFSLSSKKSAATATQNIPPADKPATNHPPKETPAAPQEIKEKPKTSVPAGGSAVKLKDTNLQYPPKACNNRQTKKWYKEHNNGVVPSNWTERPGIPKGIVKDLKELGTAMATRPPLASTTPIKQPEAKVEAAKEQLPINANPARLIIDADSKSRLHKFLSKITDVSSNEISNSLDMQKIEEKAPKFSSVAGIKLEEVHKWSHDRVWDLVQNHPKATFNLLLELRREHINTAPPFEGEKPADAPLEAPAPSPATVDPKTAPAPAAKKFAGFAFGTKKVA